MLHDTSHLKGAYCGPTAIVAVTGADIETVYAIIRRRRRAIERERYGRVLKGGMVLTDNGRNKKIVGLATSTLKIVMARLGWRVIETFKPKLKPVVRGWGHQRETITLRMFCEDRGHMGPYIVWVTGHYVVVENGMITDTQCRTPIPWQQYPKLKWHVQEAWRFAGRQRRDPAVEFTLA